MPVAKDPAIKLFGKTIAVPDITTHRLNPSSSPPVSESIDVDRLSGFCISSEPVRKESDKDGQVAHVDDTSSEGVTCSSVKEILIVDIENSCRLEEVDQLENVHVKGLKKPDKILPCPRCQSMETKFCYYNNYNVNQPRHFCKHCQRYWTAGGTMRNVPVGAGRRKNKVSSSHLRVSDSPQSNLNDIPNTNNQPSPILNFVSTARESEVSDQSASFNAASWPCYSGTTQLFPVQLYPAFWGCGVAPCWNGPWLLHPPSSNISSSSPVSPTLGKHSRDSDEEPDKDDAGKVLWVPKTSRIGDPREGARHSVWAALGMKSEKVNLVDNGKLFATFPSGGERNHETKDSPWVSLRSPTWNHDQILQSK